MMTKRQPIPVIPFDATKRLVRHAQKCTCATCIPTCAQCDFCADCGLDYDAMSPAERAQHGTEGEYIIRTCKGHIQ